MQQGNAYISTFCDLRVAPETRQVDVRQVFLPVKRLQHECVCVCVCVCVRVPDPT